MPKIMKKVQQMSTMLPIGFKLLISVITTSFTPGARFITRRGRRARNRRKTRITPNIFGESKILGVFWIFGKFLKIEILELYVVSKMGSKMILGAKF